MISYYYYYVTIINYWTSCYNTFIYILSSWGTYIHTYQASKQNLKYNYNKIIEERERERVQNLT